jgi:hypothetical protein
MNDNDQSLQNETQSQKRNLGAIAWGAFFIWWGITELFPSLPAGTGPLGVGLILLGLNAARHSSGEPTNHFSISVGILAVVWGGLELAGIVLNLPFEIPVFAILLIVLGVMILAPELSKSRNETIGGM